jgi:biotin operon repressor
MESRLYKNKKEWKTRLIIHIIMAVVLLLLYVIVCKYPVGEYFNQREEQKLYQIYSHGHGKKISKSVDTSNIPIQTLIQKLKKSGLEIDDTISDSHTYLLLTKAKLINIDNEIISIFEYDNSDAAENAALGISKYANEIRGWSINNIPSQNSITTTYIHWAKPPHFFKTRNLIVLYVGKNHGIIHSLEDIAGSQFAGRKENIIYRFMGKLF